MIKKIYRVMMLSALVTLFSFSSANAQSYRYPLDVTMSLSGNYGELRGNHFHGGIDFRVGGVVGAPIYAAEKGYVSRITVSPTGYGNALYITHPNGFVTVYGHMLSFNDKIQKFVRQKQYESEEFRQDLSLTPDIFPLAKGDLIGKAGNSGSSGGPHLHFEIRDTSNLQLNVFDRGLLNIADNTPPVISSVAFYAYTKDTGAVKSYYLAQKAQNDGIIRLPEFSYIAIDATDRQAGTAAKLAVNEYKVFVDDELIYHLNIGEVSLGLGRYINSLIEYKQKSVNGKSMIKSYVEPGNVLADRIEYKNEGLIILKDTLTHKVKVEVLDYKKNKTVRNYSVKRDDAVLVGKIEGDTLRDNYISWYLPGFYSTPGLDITIPQGALYNSIYLDVDTLSSRVTNFAPVWKIHNSNTPLHFPMDLVLNCSVPDSLSSKVFLAIVGKTGRISYAGGVYDAENGAVRGKVSSLGNYTVAADLTPPKVTPSIANNAVLKSNNLSFRMSDNLSGIKKYRVEIDGHWVLAEYDAKTSKVTIPLLYAKIKKGIKHNMVIMVVDNVYNEVIVKRAFTW